MPVTYSIGLTLLFYVLVVAEFFIPSGGLLGISAVVTGIAAVVVAMTHSLTWGLSVLLFILLTTPILFSFVLQFWPKTPIGRRMLNRQSDTLAPTVESVKTLDGVPLEQLVGKTGMATSPLLPAGSILVEGHKTDAISTGQPIEAGTPIVVVRLNMRTLQVRPATPEDLAIAEEDSAKLGSGATIRHETTSNATLEQIDLDAL